MPTTLDDLIAQLQEMHNRVGHGKSRVRLFDKSSEHEFNEFEVTLGNRGEVWLEF